MYEAMSGSDGLRHIHAYNGLYCESPPGEYPMMVPDEGTNCPECKRREAAFDVMMREYRKKEKARLDALYAQWAEEDRAKAPKKKITT